MGRRQKSESENPSPAKSAPSPLKKSTHPCFACALCCTYVATQIDTPTTMTDYDHISWYLYHENILVYVDWDDDWYIQFATRCENLSPNGLCEIYDHRPAICKDFDWRDCEKQVDEDLEPPEKFIFRNAPEFFDWLAKQRPRTYDRYREFLAAKHSEKNDPELQRLE